MKRIVPFVLLLAAAAGSAQAQSLAPIPGHTYTCDYTNPTMHELDPGQSIFDVSGDTYIQGIEQFQALFGGRVIWDNRKVTFANGRDIIFIDRWGNEVLRGTRWEFTINPSGPQCTNTIVRPNGSIQFLSCSDGHSRTCSP